MTAELERLKTTCLAQEAEIARLQDGFDELKKTLEIWVDNEAEDDYDCGFLSASRQILDKINRITGESE